MRKTIVSLLLACVLLAVSLSALSEAAVAYEPLNFGDFSMAIDPDMAYTGLEDKKENEVWFTLYPAYNAIGDSSTNFNVVWQSQRLSISSFKDSDSEAYITSLKNSIVSQYESFGFTVKSFTVPSIQLQDLNGKPSLAYVMITEIESMGVSQTIYQLQASVSDTFGTYSFTGSATSIDLLETYVGPLFDAISWND